MPVPDDDISGRFAYEGLDRLIHEKARLGILTSLIRESSAGLTFNELKDRCALTDGNLSRHLNLLEEGGLVRIEKGNRNNRPLTTVHLTDAGRTRFHEYLNILEAVLKDALPADSAVPSPATRPAFSS
ncbi:transcriptional regulator [Zavarzinella formosa]|uniref:transcriptional regulator n=1 Tax=Zavarzinella formosa TaxID=360055 RepID=UPI000303B6FE|nr:transcriptional regulator [Zavarzinella formosa]